MAEQVSSQLSIYDTTVPNTTAWLEVHGLTHIHAYAPPRPEDGDGAEAEAPRREDVAVAQDVARHAARLHESVGEEEDDARDGVEDHLCRREISWDGPMICKCWPTHLHSACMSDMA